ncbi:MAG: hypothetical protein J1F13_01070 [Prevotellaceae bacterium]|nr:hypothetical protein [Prevotellaceae bacterium]
MILSTDKVFFRCGYKEDGKPFVGVVSPKAKQHLDNGGNWEDLNVVDVLNTDTNVCVPCLIFVSKANVVQSSIANKYGVFSTNTHHAYLNTKIIIRNNTQETIVVKDLTTLEEWRVKDAKDIFLSAGEHTLIAQDTKVTVYVEDAVKFGGSIPKKGFVFDNNPWAFVVMRDRLYSTNIETGEEKVEYSITPDAIESFEPYNGKPCEYFLFNTQDDYSIYNVETGKVIMTFTNHIYSNNHLVIYRINKGCNDVVVYDYRLNNVLVKFNGAYSVGNKLYYINDSKLYGFNLVSNEISIISAVGEILEDFFLYESYLIKLTRSNENTKTYMFYYLCNDKNTISSTTLTLPYYIDSWLGYSKGRLAKSQKKYRSFIQTLSAEQKAFSLSHNEFFIKVNALEIDSENVGHIVKLQGELLSYPSIGVIPSFSITAKVSGQIDFQNRIMEKPISSNLSKEKVQDKTHNTFPIPKEETLLGESSSGNIAVTFVNNRLCIRNRQYNSQQYILQNIFDATRYESAYFTSDGKHVVLKNINNEFCIHGFENMSVCEFDIEGLTVPQMVGFNGYKPLIELDNTRQPIWRDPITFNLINETELSNRIFMSVDGAFSARNNFISKYYDRIKNREISEEEYSERKKKYNFAPNDTKEEREQKIQRRKQLYNYTGKEILFFHIIEKWHRIISSDNQSSKIEREKTLTRIITSEIEDFLNCKDDFTSLFVDRLDYVVYRNEHTQAEKELLIERNVWYLNYVSFSYDSRYLALAAKLKEDEFRNFAAGVFVLYDLQEEKEIIRQDIDSGLYAVWMTLFSKDGNVAYYDSRPHAFIRTKDSNYSALYEISDKSLLCCSPSGRFIAFSDQKYIDYTHHPEENWGHQPSGNVFIHEMKNVKQPIEQFNDFGEGICGIASRAGSIASAAFSTDEKRLLAVGTDGVVVIRNLHLDENYIKIK